MSQKTRQKILEIIAAQALLDVKDISLDRTLVDLGIDSLALVESIFAFEEAFNIDVPFNANNPDMGGFDISTVGSVVSGIEKLVAEQAI
ncbi:MAG: phosphopantetheine-binding protein [Paracoccaceae bacterium]